MIKSPMLTDAATAIADHIVTAVFGAFMATIGYITLRTVGRELLGWWHSRRHARREIR